MKRIIVQLIGDIDEDLRLRESLLGDREVILLVDTDDPLACAKLDGRTVFACDYRDSTRCAEILGGFLPIDAVLISPNVLITDSTDPNESARIILTKCFHAVKSLYQPLMQQRRGKIWILEPTMTSGCGLSNSVESIYGAVTAGIRALAGIAAMELSRKAINVNYVGNTTSSSSDKLASLILWSLDQERLFITAQALRV